MDMVVGVSEATMKSILCKLGGLLAQEYSLIRGVRGDIQYINDELASMQAFLCKHSCGGQEVRDPQMKDWMKQIRDMAYDCEDCIDDFAHRLPNDSISDATCYSWTVTVIKDVGTWWPRREIASSIAELKVRAQLIAERRTRYAVENPSNTNGKSYVARADMYDDAEHQLSSRQIIGMKEPVGMENHMEELDKWAAKTKATEETPAAAGAASAAKDVTGFNPPVLSIVGFGGVGKTTIATALYHKIKNDFDCRASVTVSQNYDEDALLRSILHQVMPRLEIKEDDGVEIGVMPRDGTRKELIPGEEVMPRDGDNGHQGSRTGKTNRSTHVRSRFNLVVRLIRCQGSDISSDSKQNKIETMNNKELIEALKIHLDKKSYLLFIDDIWSANTWRSIKHLLPPESKEGSRIIVTSRFQAVGANCSPRNIDHVYQIPYLSLADSKKLFVQSVDESKSSKHSEAIQNQVPDLWKICGGLPLAIVTMAGLVACNPSKKKEHWIDVSKSLFPEQVTHLTSYELPEQVASLTLDGITRILDYCYDDLPGDLKTCLLYLSIFPKGWHISRKCLTRRWIAEGYVSKKPGLIMEEVAETYFNQLLRRKLIRPVEHGSNGKVKTFQVHDMLLDYIVSKASEENFITVIGGHLMVPAPSNKVRRLSMQSSGSKRQDSTKALNLSQVRSLTVFGSLRELPFNAINNRIIQVLDLADWKGLKNKHMNDICEMFVLKYLSIRRTNIGNIPSKIEKLEYLETLDIRETKIRRLPEAVGKLKRISSILGGNKNPREGLMLPQERKKSTRIRVPEKSKAVAESECNDSTDASYGMKELRVLSGIEIDDQSTEPKRLHQMTGLRKLAIYKLSVEKDSKTCEELLSSIQYLCSCGLHTLAINDEKSDFINSLDKMSAPPRYLVALELSGNLTEAPKWIRNLHTLKKLTLSITVLRTDTLVHLRGLPQLFSLTFSLSAELLVPEINNILEENKTDGEIFVPDEGFKSLKLLRLIAPRVPKMGFSHNAMPEVEMIEMQFKDFEGLFGIDTLGKLRGVYLRVKDKANEITQFHVDNLKNNTYGLKVSVQHIVAAA